MAKIHRTKLQGLPSYFTSWGLKPFDNDAAFVTAKGSVATEGDAYYNSTDDDIRVFDGTNWRTVITADASGNVIIDGNLTVDGTTVTLNTQTLDVEDVNITVNHNGNQTSADNVAGITVEMSDAQDAALIYDKDVASKFLIGETNTLKEVATVSDTQTLTNKTIAAGNNTISGLLHGTHVDNPTSGVHGVTGSVVGTTDTQTLTGKTIDGDLNTLSNLAHGAEVDNPTSGVHGVTGSVVGTTDTQTLTNKTIDAALNTISNIDNDDIAAGAAIARNKLANGTADHVIINDASGVMSSEAALAKVRGGTGADNSSVTFPSTGTIATLAGTESFSNKSISDALTYSHITTPASPSAGALKIYAKNDDKFYKLNSVGEEVEIGSGAGGAGGINFFLNGDFETNINDWTSSNAGVALSADTSTPLVGTRSLLVTKDAANRENEFVSGTTRDIDLAYRGRPLPFSFEFDTTDANYASEDVRVAVYDNTNAAYLYVAPVSNVSDTLGLLKTSGKALVMVYPEDTTVSITPRLIINSTNASSYALKFDAFKIGPDQLAVVGSGVIGEVVAIPSTTTPANFLYCNGQAVSRTTYSELFAIIGTAHGTGDGSTTFNLPDYRGRFLRAQDDGASRDPNDTTRTAMNTGGNTGDNVGSVQLDAFQGHEHTQLGVSAATSASGAVTRVAASNQATQAIVSDGVNGTPRTSSETRPVNAYVRYYIRYSTGGNVVSTTEAAFSTTVANGTWSGSGSSYDFSLTTSNDDFNIVASNEITIPKTGWYTFDFHAVHAATWTNATNLYRLTIGKDTGSGYSALKTYEERALIADSNIRTLTPSYTDKFNRGDKIKFSSFNSVSTTLSGTWSITARPDFSTSSVFGKRSTIELTSSGLATYSTTAAQWGDATSQLLEPGEYDFDIQVLYYSSGATTTTTVNAGYSTTSGNSSTGLVIGDSRVIGVVPNTSTYATTLNLHKKGLVITTPTTYYLKTLANTSITNLQYAYKWSITKVK